MAASKMVIDRKKSADAVVAAGRNHEQRIATALEDQLGEEVGPAAALLLNASVRVLERSASELLAADERHNAELADDDAPRQRRDEATLATRLQLLEDRGALTTVAGPRYVAELGFSGTTPDQPDPVLELARVVVKRLGENKAPKSRLADYQFDPAKWIAPYGPLIARLEQSLQKVHDERREAEATQVDKDRALSQYDRTFSGVASLVSSLLTLGGESELARRVRPSTRRSGVTTEVDEEPTAPVTLEPEPA